MYARTIPTTIPAAGKLIRLAMTLLPSWRSARLTPIPLARSMPMPMQRCPSFAGR